MLIKSYAVDIWYNDENARKIRKFGANLIVAFIEKPDYNGDYNFRFYEWDG